MKIMIVIFLCSFSILAHAMKENTERSLKNTWHKLDAIAGKIRRGISYEDFLVAQCNETQRNFECYVDMLPDGLGEGIVEQLETEKKIIQQR